MKTRGKTLLILGCMLVLLGVGTIGVLAYFTDVDAVTNTFTVGNVDIELDEADVKPDGTYEKEHDDRVKANEYHLIPGHTYIKDPTVTVKAGSEDAYVRMLVKVENIENLETALPNDGSTAKYYAPGGTFLLQMLCLDDKGDMTWNEAAWAFKEFDTTTSTYEFRYSGTATGIVAKSSSKTILPDLFTHITLPGEIDNAHLAKLIGEENNPDDDVKIVVTAQAIQADGFDNADAAWAAFDGQVPTNVPTN